MDIIPDGQKKFSFKRSVGGTILSIIIAVGVISFLIEGNFHELANEIQGANLWLITLAIGLYFVEVGFWTGRWKIALDSVDKSIGLGSLYLISHGGKFVTNVTPILKAGGDPFRAYFAKKTQNLQYEIGFGTLTAESAVSVPVFLSFLTAGLGLWLYLVSGIWIAIAAVIPMGIFAVSFIPLVRRLIRRETAMNQIARLISWTSAKIGQDRSIESTTKSLKKFYKSTNFLMEHRKATFYMILLSSILYLTTILRFHIIFLALNLHVAWYLPLLGATVPFLLGLIPFSPGGLIFVEGGMIGLFVALGIPGPTAGSVVVIERGISYFISTIAGGLAASYLGLKIWKD